MCGVFGVIAHFGIPLGVSDRVSSAMNVMAAMSATRGTDATGIAQVFKCGSAVVYKDNVDSCTMLMRSRWRTLVRSFPSDLHVLMGHTRSKSQGLNVQYNAHPFQFVSPKGALVGSHNGTVYNHSQFGPKKSPYDSDSRNILFRLSKQDDMQWPETLKQLNGGYVLVVTRGSSVYLVRNGINKCHTVFCPNEQLTFYASTERILYSGVSMGRFDFEAPGCIPTHTLVKYTYASTKVETTSVPYVYSPPSTPYTGGVSGVCVACSTVHPREKLIMYGGSKFKCLECASKAWNDVEENQPTQPPMEGMECAYD